MELVEMSEYLSNIINKDTFLNDDLFKTYLEVTSVPRKWFG